MCTTFCGTALAVSEMYLECIDCVYSVWSQVFHTGVSPEVRSGAEPYVCVGAGIL